MEKWKSINK